MTVKTQKEEKGIRIKGARHHNLKNLDLVLPHHALTVITGPSGSGKSSLAFDTLFAEGQRRYVQSLSSYARQFLDQMEKPDVDSIEGLSPAVAIEQRGASGNSRSTIATVTEIYDYLRVLYANCGQVHHPQTGKKLKKWSAQEIVDRILQHPVSERFQVLAPVVDQELGEFWDVFTKLKKEGFLRVRVDGVFCLLEDTVKLNPKQRHTIDVVIDRLKVDESIRSRLSDSIELALKRGDGIVRIVWMPDRKEVKERKEIKKRGNDKKQSGTSEVFGQEWVLSNQNFDPETGYRFPHLTPKHFSFNNPLGACSVCHGMGTVWDPDPDLVVPDPELTVAKAIKPWVKSPKRIAGYYEQLLKDLSRQSNVSLSTKWKNTPQSFQDLILYGSGNRQVEITVSVKGKNQNKKCSFEGVLEQIRTWHQESESAATRKRAAAFMGKLICPDCEGKRLRKEVLSVFLKPSSRGQKNQKGISLFDFCQLTISEAYTLITSFSWSEEEEKVNRELIREVTSRLRFLVDVGVGYLSLNRESGTLSGGEVQRIRLATQIGAGLTGVLYILDEPSIGLHQRDNERLLNTIFQLRDRGNTVIVVEHDEDTIREADHVVDLGPAAGAGGGFLVAEGTPHAIEKNKKSLTGRYLRGERTLAVPSRRSKQKNEYLTIRGAAENNLKNIDVSIPLGTITCVTGVSGSGKSTLVSEILSKALFRHFYQSKEKPGIYQAIEGLEKLDKVVAVDQSPIGRTPRSNPITYVGAFDGIRELFAKLPASKIRGYRKNRFSFNTPGGRCEHCKGDGYKKVEMSFLPDVYVRCEACKGKRFNRETLEVTYKGHSISDILEMTISDGYELFRPITGIEEKLNGLLKVGLGYLSMGQSATTLSGGEAQRVKLAAELAKKSTGRTCFIMDEPTTGLHFSDIEQLLSVLFTLRNSGNTIVIVEHQLDVIKSADYVIDMGPEGGETGGEIVQTGTPEEIASCESSHTGRFLRKKLNGKEKFENIKF